MVCLERLPALLVVSADGRPRKLHLPQPNPALCPFPDVGSAVGGESGRADNGDSMEPLGDHDPRNVARYRLVGRLGSGAMGAVFLAQTDRGAPVAIKVIRADLLSDPELRARFAREVDAAVRVTSPYTARVLDADTTGAQPYLVTEYVAGETLASHVRRQGALMGEELRAVAAGLASGIETMHAVGVVHRDLSPRNVMLAADGPRIIDLGVARLAEVTELTATGTSLGTPGFMAPEHLEGDAGPASDVFSWGALVVYAASGNAPFGTGPTGAVVYRSIHEPPDLGPLTGDLRGMAAAALEKDPEARPTAAKITRQLARVDHAAPDDDVTVAIETIVADGGWAGIDTGTLALEASTVAVTTASSGAPTRRRVWERSIAATAVVLGIAGTAAAMTLTGGNEPTVVAVGTTAEPTPAPATSTTAPALLPTAEPTPTPAATAEVATVGLDDLDQFLPDFHDELVRATVPRGETEDAVMIASATRTDAERTVAVSLFEHDRGGYKLADQVSWWCGYLDGDVEVDDGPTFYVPCTGGASARYLHIAQADELALRMHPDVYQAGEHIGYLNTWWERLPVTGGPDDLEIGQNTCLPSCADGGLISFHLTYDDAFRWWDAISCTMPDMETWELDVPRNVRGFVDVSDIDWC